MRLNDRARNKGRMAIYAMAGFYLDYLAYTMFKQLPTSSGNEKLLMMIFMVFFAVVGTGMIAFGLINGSKLNKQGNEPEQSLMDEENEEIEDAKEEIERTADKKKPE